MSEVPSSWLEKAEGNLRRAKAAYNDEEYWDAVSHLQQADEKIAKAMLLGTGLLPSSEEMRAAMTSILGVEKTKPEELGHNWHANLIGDFEPSLDSFEKFTKSLEKGRSEQSKAAAKWWKDSLPDYKARLKKAKAVKTNPSPSVEELDGVLTDCNRALDFITATPTTIKVGEVTLPKPEEIDESFRSILKGFGIKMDKESRIDAETRTLSKFSNMASAFNGIFIGTVQSSYLIVELAVLNVYLSRHHTLANYPTNKVIYDKKLPLVERFEELHTLLQRSLKLARRILQVPES